MKCVVPICLSLIMSLFVTVGTKPNGDGNIPEVSLNAPSAVAVREAPSEEVITISSFDKMEFDGKLRLPSGGEVPKLVIFVNGSGPNTYDNHRSTGGKEFNYFDLFANEFNRRGIAFFSYNTRGVKPDKTPPYYASIDKDAYQTYKPSNQVKDVECIIRQLKSIEALKNAKVYLLGWSEGSFIAPLVAKNGNVPVDALLLAGYMNGSMAETLEWQQSGGSSMVFYRQYFDYDGNGNISPKEFSEDRYQLQSYLGATFEQIDMNGDGILNEADFALLLAENRKAVFAAFEGGDDEWLAKNYPVMLTSDWYLDFATLPTNRETLPALDLPIHIFHGVYDANVSIEGVHDIEAAFKAQGKTNLTTHVFDNADHDLNYIEFVTKGTIPEGIQSIFTVSELLDAGN